MYLSLQCNFLPAAPAVAAVARQRAVCSWQVLGATSLQHSSYRSLCCQKPVWVMMEHSSWAMDLLLLPLLLLLLLLLLL
jgi:hypothetical protein